MYDPANDDARKNATETTAITTVIATAASFQPSHGLLQRELQQTGQKASRLFGEPSGLSRQKLIKVPPPTTDLGVPQDGLYGSKPPRV